MMGTATITLFERAKSPQFHSVSHNPLHSAPTKINGVK